MNEKLKSILENAIREEEYFHQFYSELAGKVHDESMKSALLELAEQENLHKEKLESLNLNTVGVIADKMDAINIASEPVLDHDMKFENIKEMFRFAMKQEVIARTTYEQLADAMEGEAAKELLLMLAEEERKHEQILGEQLNKL